VRRISGSVVTELWPWPNYEIILCFPFVIAFFSLYRLIEKIKEVQTLIIIGETGSGKTTQIPQFLHEAGFSEKGLIGVTQPRRVAAITVATRVAKEKNCRIGELVGYSVRFEDNSSHNTKIKVSAWHFSSSPTKTYHFPMQFLTDGTLLREALGDRLLKKYRVIILDEAHERTINTDILFGIVKEAQRIRSEKKLLPLKVYYFKFTGFV
jgi:ATP-dependent RNA helicase DHX33